MSESIWLYWFVLQIVEIVSHGIISFLQYLSANHICNFLSQYQLECGPMPNVMAAQPNVGDALCESSIIPFLVPCHKVCLMAAARVPSSNAANMGEHKTWTQSEFCSWAGKFLLGVFVLSFVGYCGRVQPTVDLCGSSLLWTPVRRLSVSPVCFVQCAGERRGIDWCVRVCVWRAGRKVK